MFPEALVTIKVVHLLEDVSARLEKFPTEIFIRAVTFEFCSSTPPILFGVAGVTGVISPPFDSVMFPTLSILIWFSFPNGPPLISGFPVQIKRLVFAPKVPIRTSKLVLPDETV